MFNPIARAHLMQRMCGCREVSLTVLLAPAGSGKSTLLSQWQDANTELNIARLNLEVRDCAPMVFFRRFVDVIKAHAPMLDISTFNIFSREMNCPVSSICDGLMLALDSVDDELFIILDDYQLADTPVVHQVMASLINQLPSHIHIVISTRTYPDFSLSRLRLADSLSLIDGDDLRISRSQLQSLSDALEGVTLSQVCLDRILDLTEGWAVGVRMALLACARSGESALDSFTGSLPELVDYFGYVVLNALPDDVRRLLIRSSIFEQFDAELWEQALVSESAHLILNKLLSQGVFIVPASHSLDCDGKVKSSGYYRYHGLLHDFLATRLASEETVVEIQALHRSAADAWMNKGGIAQAIEHASQAGDVPFYHALLRTACADWLKKGALPQVIQCLSDLSDEQLLGDQALFEAMVFALIFSRRFNQAQFYLELLHSTRKGSDNPTCKSSVLRFLELTLNVFLNDEDYVSADELGLMSSTAAQKDTRAFSMVIVAYFQLQRGWLELAINTATRARSILSHLGMAYLASYADLIIALCDRYMGRGLSAVEYIDGIYQTFEDKTDSPCWVNIATGMIVVYYEQNQLEEAQAMCERVLPRVNYSCATEVVSTVYLSLARLLYLKGDVQKSVRLLDRLDRILILGKYPRFKSQVAQESMRQALKLGSLELAERVAETYDLISLYDSEGWLSGDAYFEGRERFGLALSYLFRLQGKWDQAEALLKTLHRIAEGQNVKARALIAECNRIVVLYCKGAKEKAANLLKRQLDLLGLELFSRCIFDEAPGLETVFLYAEKLNILSLPEFYKVNFRDLLKVEEQETLSGVDLSQLTNKEREIFDLLVAGLSNPKISDQLGIALSTTKWHLKNIYAKLGVNNRTSAIVIARKVI